MLEYDMLYYTSCEALIPATLLAEGGKARGGDECHDPDFLGFRKKHGFLRGSWGAILL